MKILKKIGLFVFAFFFILICLLLTTSFLLKISLKPSSISKYVEENDLTLLLKTSKGEDSSILKETKYFLNDLGISSNTIDYILESDITKKYMGEMIENYILYYLGEKEAPVFDSSMLKKILRENQQMISWMLKSDSKQNREKKMRELEKKIDEHSKDILSFFPTIQNILKRVESEKTYFGLSTHQGLKLISLMMSKKWIITLFVNLWISLIMMFVLATSLEEVYKSLSISFSIYTALLIVLEIILGTVIKSKLMIRLEVASVLINYLLNVLSKDIFVFVIVGIICSIFFYKFPKIRVKKTLTMT